MFVRDPGMPTTSAGHFNCDEQPSPVGWFRRLPRRESARFRRHRRTTWGNHVCARGDRRVARRSRCCADTPNTATSNSGTSPQLSPTTPATPASPASAPRGRSPRSSPTSSIRPPATG